AARPERQEFQASGGNPAAARSALMTDTWPGSAIACGGAGGATLTCGAGAAGAAGAAAAGVGTGWLAAAGCADPASDSTAGAGEAAAEGALVARCCGATTAPDGWLISARVTG